MNILRRYDAHNACAIEVIYEEIFPYPAGLSQWGDAPVSSVVKTEDATNPDVQGLALFVIGYGSGGVAAVYAYRLLRGHLRPNLRPGDNPAG